MEQIAIPDGSVVWVTGTDSPYQFTSPCPGDEFALFLVVGDENVTPDEQWRLSTAFVRQGCRYAVCFGTGCSTWDDSIDMVGVMDEVDGQPSPFVMTTWHDDEPIEEAAEFFATHTTFDEWVPRRFVLLVLGGDEILRADARAAVLSAFRLGST